MNKKACKPSSSSYTLDFQPDASLQSLGWLCEVSWEVCNKVGGIYTVVSSKAPYLQTLWPDRCIFFGPDLGASSRGFKAVKSLEKRFAAVSEALPEGISVRWGRWEVPGRPIAALVSYDGLMADGARRLHDIYGEMWRLYGVDSLHAYGDYDESCAFAVASAIVIATLHDVMGSSDGRQGSVAHWNEWQTAMGLLWLKAHAPNVAEVFTTHATSVGRSICGNGKPLYDYLQGYNGDQMARELNMEAKHSVEKAAAREADVFTTVSEVTAREAAQLLERRPVVTPNGFQAATPLSEATRRNARTRILKAARALTAIDIPEDVAIIATSGRHEFRNKGLDMYLDALHEVNKHAGDNDDVAILALVLVPAWNIGPREDLQRRMASGEAVTALPQPYITHYIGNPEGDEVTVKMRALGLDNNIGSDGLLPRVITLYVPCYLDGNDGILGLPYYDMLQGLDLTVFPSYYEPWGYTPHESVAYGVPTLTTSLSGFGQWARQQPGTAAVRVVERTDANYPRAVEEIATFIDYFCATLRREAATSKDACQSLATRATWKAFMPLYLEAYEQALAESRRR